MKFFLWHKITKKVFLVCGSIEQTIKEQAGKEFPESRMISIANESWSLSKNLELGPFLFGDSCRNIFYNLHKTKAEDSECPTIKEARFKRIRRLKKFLRPLPRRSNIHRYPILKWFADTAYKKSFLWSFKGSPVQSALFWGIWIAMLPIVGIQMIVVFCIFGGTGKPSTYCCITVDIQPFYDGANLLCRLQNWYDSVQINWC